MIENGVNERMMARKGGTRERTEWNEEKEETNRDAGKRKTTSCIHRRISNEHFRQDTIELK